LQSLIILNAILVFVTAQKTFNYGTFKYSSFVPLDISFNSIDIFIGLTIFILLVGAFLRLNGLVQHNDLALSKLQMALHLGAFAISTLACTLFWSTEIRFDLSPTTIENLNRRVKLSLAVGEIYEIGVFLSTIPILLILNSLLNYGIAENEQM